MSHSCEEGLIRRLKNSPHGLSLQLHESTDVAGLALLLVLVHSIFNSTVWNRFTFIHNKSHGPSHATFPLLPSPPCSCHQANSN